MSSDAGCDHTMMVSADAMMVACSGCGETLAGYTLQRRLGTGGYGEVWHAIGPGGLHKAVKILHGRYDGPEADTELKSLEKIRELRHPFLLNIERIEIADGRMIIVTELAEGSLEDLFDSFRRKGHRGIPRDMLLGALRDAADALDFMHEHHGLQHLDIKPGNLLLQGGHGKVADFGLIKDLRREDISRVGGFTPLFAPPELFEGRPSGTSDQYSLAIVYQVMLTGVPPFAGRNAAQLIAQHLSSAPDLSVLCPSDRPAMARALAKNPAARFPSCREFLDRLGQSRAPSTRANVLRTEPCPERVDAGFSSAASQETPTTSKDEGDRQHLCEAPLPLRGQGSQFPPGILVTHPTTRIAPAASATEPLSSLVLDETTAIYRPTLFLGIGGLGGKVLCGFRRRLAKQFGPGVDLPGLPLLYVDTDARAAAAACEAADGGALTPQEILTVPLRDPQYYRAGPRGALDWLSRRWLLNMPRSRQVEGVRPLGRLALVDHHEALRTRLCVLLEKARSDEALRATGERTGVPFTAGPVSVFLVASVCGGTGSGAGADVAYLLRCLFAELGLEHGGVTGVLLHGTAARHSRADIPTANSIAFLRELRHFCTPGLGYPGDPGCRLPPYPGGPFEHTYVVHLGDGLSESGFQEEIDKIAEYLYRDTLTPARAFYEACRSGERSQARRATGSSLRTFAVASIRQHPTELVKLASEALCQALVHGWRDGHRAAGSVVAEPEGSLLAGLPLDIGPWLTQAQAIVRGSPAKTIQGWFRAEWERLARQSSERPGATELRLSEIDQVFLVKAVEASDAAHPANTVKRIEEELAVFAEKCSHAIRAAVLSLVDCPEHRIQGAVALLQGVGPKLENTATQVSSLIAEMNKDLDRLRSQMGPPLPADSASHTAAEPAFREFDERHRPFYSEYCTIRLYESVYRCLVRCLERVRDRTAQLGVELTALRSRLRELENRFERPSAQRSPGSVDRLPTRAMTVQAAQNSSDEDSLVPAFENHLRSSQSVRLSSLLGGGGEAQDKLLQALRDAAADFLMNQEAAKRIAAAAVEESGPQAERRAEALEPRLSNLGGGRRVLGMVPDPPSTQVWKERLESVLGACVTMQLASHEDAFFCNEVEGCSFDAVLHALAGGTTVAEEMASRIHTRVDIQW